MNHVYKIKGDSSPRTSYSYDVYRQKWWLFWEFLDSFKELEEARDFVKKAMVIDACEEFYSKWPNDL